MTGGTDTRHQTPLTKTAILPQNTEVTALPRSAN